jgi:hypothetical protein
VIIPGDDVHHMELTTRDDIEARGLTPSPASTFA